MEIKKFVVGSPLETALMSHERISKTKALAVLSSDALSSVAYATEEALIPLAAFSAAAVTWSLPVALLIGLLIITITFSYRQTIDAYPGGGGAYTVASENLGVNAGLIAGAALLIDYVLTVAVSVSAGIENIGSAFPLVYAHKEAFGILTITLIMLVNLRGMRESSNVFALPTYFFIFSFVTLIVTGLVKVAMGQAPTPIEHIVHENYATIPLLLLMRSFASGCSALTGIEAISNGVQIFKAPCPKNAKITMLWMSGILGGLFLGITLLAHYYQVQPRDGETLVSVIASNVFGKNWMYYIVQISTALILVLAANTSYADFPRLSSLMAKDGFLPRQLSSLGDRLVFSNGILGLSLTSIFLIILFEGDTHHLIPLYAIGVFLSFTLSQFGMVRHHLKLKEKGWKFGLFINLLGALITLGVLIVVAATKFAQGAWIVILLIPVFVLLFRSIKSHYVSTALQLNRSGRSDLAPVVMKHIAIVPISGLHPGVIQSLEYARVIAHDIRPVSVDIKAEQTQELKERWAKLNYGYDLQVLSSPYRSVFAPLIEYIKEVRDENEDTLITVIIPEFVTARWYHAFLHNQSALWLYAYLRNKKRVMVTSVRYHLRA